MLSQDLENIFAMLMLALDLKKSGTKHVNFFTKNYPYSFCVEEATAKMAHLKVDIDSNSTTTTTISCGIREAPALVFLHRFMLARMIHCPADRTRQEPKGSVLLQPTAKGIFVMDRYCKKNGINQNSPNSSCKTLWKSMYNTMDCFPLDRKSQTDVIMHSNALIFLLFQRFLGPRPNIYSAMNPPDEISEEVKGVVSPYAHRYFTHPESDALSQYYVSSRGVRLFAGKKQEGNRGDFLLTGRAIWQWLMECTDIMHPNEAVALANLFIKHELVQCLTHNKQFDLSKDALYCVTDKGRKISQWKTPRSTAPSMSSDIALQEILPSPGKSRFSGDLRSPIAITLSDVLDDAGLRMLFKEHLAREFCEENLLFFTELKAFLVRVESTEHKCDLEMPPSSKKCAKKSVQGDLVSLAYAIYNRFIASGSPSEINIDHTLKSKLIRVMASNRITTEESIRTSVSELFSEAHQHVYKMMERDSLPKFIRSEKFKETVQTIAPWYF